MKSLRIKLLSSLSSGILVFFLIFTSCTNLAHAGDEIPIEGAVYSVHRSDGSQKTYTDIVISRGFSGNLPGSIDSIVVSDPEGKIILEKDDFNYNPQWRAFWSVRPGRPKIGTYQFTVTSGKKKGQTQDRLSTVVKIPLPDTTKFYPAEGNEITCMPPVFSWQLLNSEIPLFYQVEIRDIHRQHVYRSRYVEDMDSVRLPYDILKPGKTYQWRIRVADGADWLALNSRSQSKWVLFSTGKNLDSCKYSYRPSKNIEGDWKVSSLDMKGIDSQKIQELMQQILNNRIKNIHSVLLIINGELVLEEYFGGYHRNLKHAVASVTKSVTSILIGIARDRGEKIVLDGKLSSYLPEYTDLISQKGKSEITLEHLLTMRAGLEWNEMHAPTSLKHMIESSDAIEYVLSRRVVDPPGQRFFYSTGLSTVLGRILKNTTGSDAARYAEEHLFAPLGIVDYYWGKTRDGSISTGAALYLKPRDMAKLGYLFLKNGIWKDRQIVSEKWVRESIRPHVTGDLVSGTGYGYQWWSGPIRVGDRDIETFYAAGHGGQYIVQIPSLDAIAVITSEVDNNNAGDFRGAGVLENYIIPAVLNTDPVAKTPPFKADDFGYITGKYEWPKGKLGLKVLIDNGKIYGETVLFKGRFEILPVKEDRFVSFSDDIGKFRIDMVRDSNGRVEGLKFRIGFASLPFERKRGLFFGF